MRRVLAVFLLIAVIAAAASAAVAARPKGAKGQPKRTFFVVAGPQESGCALSSDPTLGDPAGGCANEYEAAAEPVLGSEPTWIPALNGLPISLDVTRPIRGTVRVRARYLWGTLGRAGAGLARLRVTVAGVAGGKEVTVGSVTSETYTVTPDDGEYEVEFRMEQDAALAGATLTQIRLGLEVLGPNVNHNYFEADASSTVTVPLAR